MARFTKRNSPRRNGERRALVHRHPRVESLESRELMAVDMTAIDISSSNTPQLIDRSLLESGSAEMVHVDGLAGISKIDQLDRMAAVAGRAIHSGNWFSNLSPVVRSSIEHARALRKFSDVELQTASSWAVVTGNPDASKELLDGINLNSVHDHTDLFGDELNVNVWEVQLARPGDYRQLVELARQATGRAGDPDTAPGIVDVIPLFAERVDPAGRLDPNLVSDPLFQRQWHLDATANSTQWGIDAEGAWSTATGEDVAIAVVDTRQDLAHPDLVGNLNAAISFDASNSDFDGDGISDNNPNVTLPGGNTGWPNILDTDTTVPPDGILDADNVRRESHGTAVAGLALGDDEGTGIVGVAPDATYAAFNFLEFNGPSFPNTFSAANINNIDVFNNSWGSKDTRRLRYRSFVDLQAIENAAVNAIFVKAASNDRNPVVLANFQGWDRANYDAYHMRQTIMVAASQQNGDVEVYSNPGSNVLVNAPVNLTGIQNVNAMTSDVSDTLNNSTDDRGYRSGSAVNTFNGTSAASPMVSGAIALMLEANSKLDWRNVQHILIDTAQKNGLIDSDGDGVFDGGDGNSDGVIDNINLRNTFLASVDTNGDGVIDSFFDTDSAGGADPYHTGWFQNAADNWVSDSFGFGMLDANSAVQAAENWVSVGPELHVNSPQKQPFFNVIPEGNLGGLNSLSGIDSYVAESHLQVEWVELTVEATVPDQSNLMLALQSPSGTQSILMAPGGLSTDNAGNPQTDIDTFTFTTNQFWDESAHGVWTLQALDTVVGDGLVGTIDNWQIDIYGTCCEESSLKVTSVTHALASVGSLAKLALAAGGLDSEMYVLNQVYQVGESASMGVFSNGFASGLPLDEGLLFTSGELADAVGPNDDPWISTTWFNPGHELLDDLTGQNTFDASGLEIYFTPTEDVEISFDHLFGSDEFDEWLVNDGAGIFIGMAKGPESHYTDGFMPPVNMAKTLNGGDLSVTDLATKRRNGVAVGKYYDPNPLCGDMNWQYDGSSLLSRTKDTKLIAGMNYYIGIMVADAFDYMGDSALAIGLDGSNAGAGDIFPKYKEPLLPIFNQAQKNVALKLNDANDSLANVKQSQLTNLRMPLAVPAYHPAAIDLAWQDLDRPHQQIRNSLLPSDRDNSALLGNRAGRLQERDTRNVRRNESRDNVSSGRNQVLRATSALDVQADALASAQGRNSASNYPAILDLLMGNDEWLDI
jgi:subtilisin-like proprotein convertase family protein